MAVGVRDTMSALGRDWERNKGNPKGRLVVLGYRIARYFAVRKRSAPVLWIVGLPWMIGYRLCVEWTLGIEIPARTDIGPGLQVWHGQALVLHYDAVLGSDVVLRHGTTIGVKQTADGNSGAPVIGDRVDVGSNSVILGPVTVGDDAVIGAGSVVTHDVPPGAVVAGPAATVLRTRSEVLGP